MSSAVPSHEQSSPPSDFDTTGATQDSLQSTKRPIRKNDRHLFQNPFPLQISKEEPLKGFFLPITIASFLQYLFQSFSSLIPFRKPPLPPYEGVLVGESGCVWILQDGKAQVDRALRWEQEFKRKSTIALEAGLTHALGLGLWRGGFFGKATLSRGEPTWWKRMARDGQSTEGESLAARRRAMRTAQRRNVPQPPSEPKSTTSMSSFSDGYDSLVSTPYAEGLGWGVLTVDPERYQLTPEEAFFLAYGLGILAVKESEEGDILEPCELWSKLRSHPNALTFASQLVGPEIMTTSKLSSEFAVRYAAYHYYRSQGWVVKSGIKFGTDYVLYRRGPIFRHSDYAVVVVPSVSDTAHRDTLPDIPARTWVWALSVNRVCAQVNKRVLLCHVVVPSDITRKELADPTCIKRFAIWDVCIGRWVPEKTRD
ncbi:tRNA intron endonuclease [Spizellomyces punctatus DAOM BR117]|uniref:tRNA-splicing endonuclease subunit Sen2 n=1 Tax=Spizellomyces punctatus (strain DAOM BR117) TaxID=645134 RepID=A0A0L0HKT4_SPIPD|nr:tRNA intron endonuclease [Spizellomyces punctatus DAOM BR117]KND01449.1 tRNA intron endonuclease [Spizellomyces punctatus DAOM BR117]|eukprot:XP_016609488.1 tRNA intron endonuclease [Spizellomyces punctatus DAOM BR117]